MVQGLLRRPPTTKPSDENISQSGRENDYPNVSPPLSAGCHYVLRSSGTSIQQSVVISWEHSRIFCRENSVRCPIFAEISRKLKIFLSLHCTQYRLIDTRMYAFKALAILVWATNGTLYNTFYNTGTSTTVCCHAGVKGAVQLITTCGLSCNAAAAPAKVVLQQTHALAHVPGLTAARPCPPSCLAVHRCWP